MKKVKIYSTSSCPYCHMAKDFLRQNKIAFEDTNIEEDTEAGQEMMRISGQYGVPVIDIDGSIVVGFDKAKLKSLLNL